MGENFTEIWQSDRCPPALKKMIFRTVVEEIVAHTDAEKKTLQFTVHWKGGTHTQLTMERPRSATDCATSMEALEVIRRMAVRHGDDQIASGISDRSALTFLLRGPACVQRAAVHRGQ